MLLHTPEQLNDLRAFASNNSVGCGAFDIAGIEVMYDVVDLGDEAPHKYAVAAAFVSEVGEIIVVDSSVPEHLRGLWAWHEKADSLHPDHRSMTSGCHSSEQTILNALRATDRALGADYIEHRTEFYGLFAADLIRKNPIGEGADVQKDVSGLRAAKVLLSSSRHLFTN
jgi:hypothetical protein